VQHGRLTIFVTVVAALLLSGALLTIGPVRDAIAAAAGGDLGLLREELDALGAVAALVLVAIALLHVIVPFPAEFPTAAAGFALGFALALPLMLVAWTLSALAAYALARVAGAPLLERLAGGERMAAAERLVARGGWPILLVGRLFPLLPYNVVSFAAGATRVPVLRFTWTTAVGIAPLTALTALLGERLQAPSLQDPWLWLVLAGVLAMLAVARPFGRYLRRRQGEGSTP
jgi:uncharacterized membrane protein YdjX (TVP38/TMEM64 family)